VNFTIHRALLQIYRALLDTSGFSGNIYIARRGKARGDKSQITTEPNVSTKEPYVSAKEPCVSTKEPYVPTKEPYVSTKEPNVFTKEPYIL